MMESFKSVAIWLGVICFLLISCGKAPEESTDQSSTSGGALTITVSTAWEGVPTEFTDHKVCAANGTPTSPVTATCNVSIPEERLFFSNTKITIAHEGDYCTLVTFRPYSFRKSLSAAYTAVGATAAVDCSAPTATTDPDACWGGPGPGLITGFWDINTFLYRTGTDDWEISIASPNSKSNGDRNLRWVANDLPTAERTTDLAMGASTAGGATVEEGFEYDAAVPFIDYQVRCIDEYGNTTSTVTLNISDDEGTSPSTDDVESWQ